MSFFHGRLAGILLGGFNLSPYLNTSDATTTVDQLDATCYGASAKAYIPGLADGKITIGGLVDDTDTSGSDAVISAALGQSEQVLTVCPQGLATIGNMAKMALCNPANYKVSSPVGGLVSFTAELPATGGIYQGGVLLSDATTAVTEDGQGSSVDNGASTSNGGVMNAHCTDISGTTPTATPKVQDSSDDVTWVDLITGDAFDAIGAQQGTATGTVERYVRGAWVMGGSGPSANLAIAFART